MARHATRACWWLRLRVSAQTGTSTGLTSWRPLHNSVPATSPSDDTNRLTAVTAELAVAETPERVSRFADLLRRGLLSAETPAGALQDQLALPSARLSRYVRVLETARSTSTSAAVVALMLDTAAFAAQRARAEMPVVEVARTGPAGGVFHLRTTG